MRAPKGIVFDLDGTLADTRLDVAAACNHGLVCVGRAPLSSDLIGTFVGDGARVLMSRALGLEPDNPVTSDALGHFHTYYGAHPATFSRLMPGAAEVLDACAALPLAVVTNKPRAPTVPLIQALGLAPHLKALVAGGDGPLKPDPAPLLAALARMGVAANDCWMVGDGPQDVRAGRAAGMTTVGVLGGFAQEAALRASEPDVIVPSLFGLVELMRRAAV
jgi:phosphoglycolate phosphatase